MGRAAAKQAEGAAPRPIIIKKVKKGGHAHHGGSWKVAFADFATACRARIQRGAIPEFVEPCQLVSHEPLARERPGTAQVA